MLNTHPQCDGISRLGTQGGGLGHENGAILNGTGILIKETTESALPLFHLRT